MSKAIRPTTKQPKQMTTNIHKAGKTQITRFAPWGTNARNGHRALCADGTIRAVELAETADTFFSTPARCRINGKWVSGYLCTESTDGSSVDHGQGWVYAFRSHTDSKPEGFPEWPDRFSGSFRALVAKAI